MSKKKDLSTEERAFFYEFLKLEKVIVTQTEDGKEQFKDEMAFTGKVYHIRRWINKKITKVMYLQPETVTDLLERLRDNFIGGRYNTEIFIEYVDEDNDIANVDILIRGGKENE